VYWRTGKRSKTRCDRVPFGFPGIESTNQGSAVKPTSVDNLRRTGAGVLPRSGSIEDDRLVAGKCRHLRAELTEWDRASAGDVSGSVEVGWADVDRDGLAAFEERMSFDRSDSGWVSR